jgi:NAD-reducing hydrogenase large subunit
MAQRIIISPVTRIEGHAKISIYVDDSGQVASAQFHVVEFRGFEKICQGRPFSEMPALTARVCGICPVSHILASAKACDALLGIAVPASAILLRRMMNYGQILQSHALSFFHLSSPDFLLGFDSDPARRNVFGLIAEDPDFARRGIRLRKFGQRVIELLGGRKIHPAWATPGGVLEPMTEAARDEIRAGIPEAIETVKIATGRMKAVLDQYPEEIEHLGTFPSLFLGLVSEQGTFEHYDGVVRICDSEGNIVADNLDPRRYQTFIGEAAEEYTYLKSPYYKPMGYPAGIYRVGPLARCNIAAAAGTPLADRELREFKQRARGGAGCQSFHYHLARLVEMMHCVERIEEIVNDPVAMERRVRAVAGLNHSRGVGFSEAPRGTLFHDYEVDENGLMTRANLIIATGQNNLAMNKAVEQAAGRFVNAANLTEGMLNRVEAAIRAYDPCLSCSTHALGQMPLEIRVLNLRGETLGRIARQ